VCVCVCDVIHGLMSLIQGLISEVIPLHKSSFYPSVFWLVGSFPAGIIASHYFHCCITVSFCVSGNLL